MKVIIIDAEKKDVRVEDIENKLSELQKAVGGYIEIGYRFPNKDILYVDEEGLFKGYLFGFEIDGRKFVGNGIIAGLKKSVVVDTVSDVEDIKKTIKFFRVNVIRTKTKLRSKHEKGL